jgi:hypothetical protein
MEGIAYVGEKRAAEAIVSCRLVDRARAVQTTSSITEAE